MLNNDELSALEAVVDECEKDIETGKISVDAIVGHIRSIGDMAAQMVRCQESIAMMKSKISKIDIVRLKDLKRMFPNDSRVCQLTRRAADCYLALNGIWLSTSEALMTPDVRLQVQSENKEIMVKLKTMVSDLI